MWMIGLVVLCLKGMEERFGGLSSRVLRGWALWLRVRVFQRHKSRSSAERSGWTPTCKLLRRHVDSDLEEDSQRQARGAYRTRQDAYDLEEQGLR